MRFEVHADVQRAQLLPCADRMWRTRVHIAVL